MNIYFRPSLIGSCLLLLITACTSTPDKGSERINDLVHSGLDSLRLQGGFKAVSLGLLIGDEQRTYHLGTLPSGKIPNDETLYEIASLTKTMTGTLLAGVVSRGQVSIEEDVRTFLPGEYPGLEFAGQAIRLKDILLHTSGLPRMFPRADHLFRAPDFNELPGQINDLQQGYTKAQFLQALQEFKLDTLPGTQMNYSNAGANVIGFCLEEMLGERYPQLLQKYLFDPLEMQDSRMLGSDLGGRSVALGYNEQDREMPLMATKYMSAEGGVLSSTRDMIEYMKFHLNTGDAIVQMAHQPLWEGQYGDFDAGFFWQLRNRGASGVEVFQNGGAYGTSSWMSLFPEEELGIFVVTNRSAPSVHQTLNLFVEQLHTALVQEQLLNH
ncbi:MAG: serine hydrolase domain-containing protein [Bacteroidota bacterium]